MWSRSPSFVNFHISSSVPSYTWRRKTGALNRTGEKERGGNEEKKIYGNAEYLQRDQELAEAKVGACFHASLWYWREIWRGPILLLPLKTDVSPFLELFDSAKRMEFNKGRSSCLRFCRYSFSFWSFAPVADESKEEEDEGDGCFFRSLPFFCEYVRRSSFVTGGRWELISLGVAGVGQAMAGWVLFLLLLLVLRRKEKKKMTMMNSNAAFTVDPFHHHY